MPKRKRDDDQPEGAEGSKPEATAKPKSKAKGKAKDDPATILLNRQREIASERIETAIQCLIRKLKLAASFERQKYSRRKKTAQETKDEAGLARLEAEYEVVKKLDFEKTARNHVKKTLARVKSIANSDILSQRAKKFDPAPKDQATLNVLARLYKTDIVKVEIDELIDELKEVVALSSAVQEPETGEEDSEEGEAMEVDQVEPDKGRRDTHADFSGGESDGGGDEEALDGDEIMGEESDTESEEFGVLKDPLAPFIDWGDGRGKFDLDSYDWESRLAPPSDEDQATEASEDEESEEESEEKQSEDEESQVEGSEEEESEEEESESSALSSLLSDEDGIPLPPSKSKTASKSKEMERPTTSTFLPSLTVGGYYSGSDDASEATDIDEPIRKNRRGQRARQKIWEKKYGQNAKHIQKAKADPRKGWDPKRGARLDDGGKSRGGWKAKIASGRGPMASGSNTTEVAPKKKTRDDAGTLHPSWEAKKLAKEKAKTVVPAGKKVVFD